MAEVTQLTFRHRELITALMRDARVHEGRWTLGVVLHNAVQPMTLGDGTVTVGAVTGFVGLCIARLEPDAQAEPGVVVVDAAEVNPPLPQHVS